MHTFSFPPAVFFPGTPLFAPGAPPPPPATPPRLRLSITFAPRAGGTEDFLGTPPEGLGAADLEEGKFSSDRRVGRTPLAGRLAIKKDDTVTKGTKGWQGQMYILTILGYLAFLCQVSHVKLY